MTHPNDKKLLFFSLAGSPHALDLAHIAEVIDLPRTMAPIPLAPACYCGAMNFHGTIVAVMDLALFLGLAGNGSGGKIIVLNPAIASLAFLVDAVIRITSQADATYAPPSADNRFSTANLCLTSESAPLLDPGLIVREAECRMQQH
jgi:chemotaxis signal transduction protein